MKILVEIAVQVVGGQEIIDRDPVYQSIELNDFLGWYDLHHWRQEGGRLGFNEVPGLVELFIKDEIKAGPRYKLGDRK